MPGFKDITGQRFGRLLVVQFDSRSKHGHQIWLCRCDCGQDKLVLVGNLQKGNTQSCGCLHMEGFRSIITKHGRCESKSYRTWSQILGRCRNPDNQNWVDYGGRGISVCQRWIESFQNFLDDMGDPPTPQHTIDRIDNDGNYEPGNCRWATRAEQSRNKRSSRMIEYNGAKKCLAEWAESLGMNQMTLLYRLDHGWSISRAFNTPVASRPKVSMAVH